MPYRIKYYNYFLDENNILAYKEESFKVGRISDIYNQCWRILTDTRDLLEYATHYYPDNVAVLPNGIKEIHQISVTSLPVFITQCKYERHLNKSDLDKIQLDNNKLTFWTYRAGKDFKGDIIHEYYKQLNYSHKKKYYQLFDLDSKTKTLHFDGNRVDVSFVIEKLDSLDYNQGHRFFLPARIGNMRKELQCRVERWEEFHYDCLIYMPYSIDDF